MASTPELGRGESASRASIQFPEGRYGWRRDQSRQRRRRWLTWVAGTLVVVLGVTIAVKLYRQYANPPFEVLNLHITDLTDTGVTVTFDVRVPAGEGATCTVRGRTFEGRTVGSVEIDVPPGPADETMRHVTYRLVTTDRPMTGEVPGCGPRRS